jgi:tRNA isopentenyl-2-thiomethyl-A-37 hydroxylase MiaE
MAKLTNALTGLLSRFFDTLMDAERRRREAYLAQATDLVDLERRIRESSSSQSQTSTFLARI